MYSFKSVIFHSTLLYFIVRKKSYSHPVKGTVIKHREPWLMAYRFPFCIFLWASPPVDLSASDALPNSTFSTHEQPSLLLAASSSRELPLACRAWSCASPLWAFLPQPLCFCCQQSCSHCYKSILSTRDESEAEAILYSVSPAQHPAEGIYISQCSLS